MSDTSTALRPGAGLPRGTSPSVLAPVAVLVFVGSFVYRYLAVELTNDDYLFFAIGRQIAEFGEWPIVDLLEEGDPLHNLVSAALQGLFGYRLAGEVILNLAMLSAAAALTFLLAATLTHSVAIALAASSIAVLSAPRLYDYPKAVLPVFVFWLCLRYMARPSRAAAIALGLTTAIAFLFRHDLGAYVSAACVSAFLTTRVLSKTSPRAFVWYGLTLIAGLIPYVVLVQFLGGVPAYVDAARRFVDREVDRSDDRRPRFAIDLSRPLWQNAPGFAVKIRWAPDVADDTRVGVERRYQLASGRPEQGRTWTYVLEDSSTDNLLAILADPRIEDTDNIDRTLSRNPEPVSFPRRIGRRLRAPPSFAIAPGVLTRNNAVAWLSFLLLTLPYIAAAMLAAGSIRAPPTVEGWRLVPAIVYCAVAAPLLLRGNLSENSRLADLITPSAVVGAWVLAVLLSPDRVGIRSASLAWTCRVAAVVVLLATSSSVVAVASVGRHLANTGIFDGGDALSGNVTRLTRDLMSSPPPAQSLSPETGVRDAVEYLRRCTASSERILVFGFYPDIVFYSGRAFVGDRPTLQAGFLTSPEEQRRVVAAMKRSLVPLALIDARAEDDESRDRAFARGFPIIRQHLLDVYAFRGVTDFGASTDAQFHVWAHRGWHAPGTYGAHSLPCRR